MQEAAARRRQNELDAIENGAVPSYAPYSDEGVFLHNIACGFFDIAGLDDVRDLDEPPADE